MEKMRPTVQEVLVTVCCPLDGSVPIDLMGIKSIKIWQSYFVQNKGHNDVCANVLTQAINCSASPKLQEVYPIASNKGWEVEFSVTFGNVYDSTYFCNMVKPFNCIKSVNVTVCCHLDLWIHRILSVNVHDMRSSLISLRDAVSIPQHVKQLDICQKVLGSAFSASSELQEVCCVASDAKGIISFTFKFDDAADAISFMHHARTFPVSDLVRT